MSDQLHDDAEKAAEARLARKNRALGLALFGLVVLIGVVSFLKLEIAVP